MLSAAEPWELDEIPRIIESHWAIGSMYDQFEMEQILKLLKDELDVGQKETIEDLMSELRCKEYDVDYLEEEKIALEDENYELSEKLKKIERAWQKAFGKEFDYHAEF